MQNTKSQSDNDVAGKIIGAIVRALAVSLLWSLLLLIAYYLSYMLYAVAALAVLAIACIAVAIWQREYRCLYPLPLAGDIARGLRRHERKLANGYLRKSPIFRVRESDDKDYPAYLRKPNARRDGYLDLRQLRLTGFSRERLEQSLGDDLTALWSEDFAISPDNWRYITLYDHDRLLELADPITLDSLPAVKIGIDELSVNVGEDLDGAYWLDFSNISGFVVGGTPGAGKTASVSGMVAALAVAGCDLYVIDGKGDTDWAWIASVAKMYCSAARVTDDVLSVVTAVEQRLADRKAQPHEDSNYWHRAPSAAEPPIILLIDECQAFFSPLGLDRKSKDEVSVFTRRVNDLIATGRSAGVIVMLMTQKPTADSLPTALRDRCGRRVAFATGTREAAEATLGELPEDTRVLPTKIPIDQRGLSVVGTDSMQLQYLRWYYVPERTLKKLVAAR